MPSKCQRLERMHSKAWAPSMGGHDTYCYVAIRPARLCSVWQVFGCCENGTIPRGWRVGRCFAYFVRDTIDLT